MAKILAIENMSHDELTDGIAAGGKFVMYQYVISILILSFKRASPIYYIPAGASRVPKGLMFSGIALVLGWWGIPWGLFWTPMAIFRNFRGGKDVTAAVCHRLLNTTPEATIFN